MLRRAFILALFLVNICTFASVARTKELGRELKIMSYNIRQGACKDGDNSWEFRRPATIEMLNDQVPDVFGTQEALGYQVQYIEENCTDYDWVGVGRDDGVAAGEYMAIFWNKKTIKMLDWGTFWLSETPEAPSMGWDAKCMRTATWALLKDRKTGNKFYFVNTHLDHIGKEAQKNGLMLIVSRIDSINPDKYPMVLTGDFNVRPDNPALIELNKLMASSRDVAPKTDRHNTFNGWSDAETEVIIDYIYISGFSSCLEYQTITKQYDDIPYVSDHYPIIARVIID